MKKVGYYPGCSLNGTAKEYEMSIRKVANLLEVELVEINDWNCCGATSAHVTSHKLAVSLSLRNLVLAAEQGIEDIMAPCAACYSRLTVSKNEVLNNPKVKTQIEEILEKKIDKLPNVINIVEFFKNFGIENLLKLNSPNLKFLNAACYYGCLLVRPAGNFDDSEEPKSMEELVSITGAKTVDWNFKTDCCGAAHSVPRKDIVVDLSKKILDDAKKHGANVLIVACPMCHTNLDMRQRAIMKEHKDHNEIPVLYLSELLGLALGLNLSELGIDLHIVKYNLKANNN